jgi:hypothetical protein
MTARKSLLRIAARATTHPDFDPIRIPDVQPTIDVLQHECPEFFIVRTLQHIRPAAVPVAVFCSYLGPPEKGQKAFAAVDLSDYRR